MNPPPARPARCRVEIDPTALAENFTALQRHARPSRGIICVIKANAYGHGADIAVRALPYAAMFAVATLEEAMAIRSLVNGRDILLLSPSLPDEYPFLVQEGFVATVSSADEAKKLAAHAGKQPVRISVSIDTGMGRMGIWRENARSELETIRGIPGVEVHSIATHLPSADEDACFTCLQLQQIAEAVPHWRKLFPGAAIHVANSACSLLFPEAAYDLIRPGLALYGVSPVPQFQPLLRPALTWKAAVTLVRDVDAGRTVSYGRTFTTDRPMRLATLGVGYADGYPRHVSNRGQEVLLHGKRCTLLGRITMDQIVIDASQVPEAKPGDDAVLLGPARRGGDFSC